MIKMTQRRRGKSFTSRMLIFSPVPDSLRRVIFSAFQSKGPQHNSTDQGENTETQACEHNQEKVERRWQVIRINRGKMAGNGGKVAGKRRKGGSK